MGGLSELMHILEASQNPYNRVPLQTTREKTGLVIRNLSPSSTELT